MLVIRRHPGQAIQIGEDVEVLVIDCGSGRVKLGIRAPKQVHVMRSEVRHTREENLVAARAFATAGCESPPETSAVVPLLLAVVP